MTKHFENLPGNCFVKHIKSKPKGITLNAELLKVYGFQSKQATSILFTQGQIIITNIPEQVAIHKGIEELQFRQDELKTDFSGAILCCKRSALVASVNV